MITQPAGRRTHHHAGKHGRTRNTERPRSFLTVTFLSVGRNRLGNELDPHQFRFISGGSQGVRLYTATDRG